MRAPQWCQASLVPELAAGSTIEGIRFPAPRLLTNMDIAGGVDHAFESDFALR
jgi:hypothetical protein